MTTEDDVTMASHLDLDRQISAVRSPASKPEGGARILCFLLQALVMAVALSLFFFFAGVAAIILIHLFVAGRALRCRRRRRLLHPHRSRPPNPNPNTYLFEDPGTFGLSSEELKSLPSFVCSTAAARTASSDCAVCLEGFRDGDRCRNLPECGHSFHRGCVDRWLMRSASCPICRRGVLPASD